MGTMMNFDNQDRQDQSEVCHAERSEASDADRLRSFASLRMTNYYRSWLVKNIIAPLQSNRMHKLIEWDAEEALP